MSKLTAVFAVALLFLNSESVRAQSTGTAAPNGILTGLVKDTAGHGIGGAMIVATHSGKGTETRVNALSNGRFALTGLELNVPYSVKVASIGYEPVVQSNVVIPQSGLLRMDFVLDKDPTHQLSTVTITAPVKGSKLSKKFLGGEEIRAAKVRSALDAIMRLRPVMLAPDYDICITNDSLSLYVDGIRRPVYNPTDNGFGAVRTVVRQGRNRGAVQTTGSTNEEIVLKELEQIPVDEIFDIKFVSCDDWDPSIGKRNVIWIRSPKFALTQEKLKKERGW